MVYNEIMKKILLVFLIAALAIPAFASSAAGTFKDRYGKPNK